MKWMDNAACRGEDIALFYPDTPGTRAVEAKRFCVVCPVREPCLQQALTNGEFGVWGGTTDEDRRRLRRQLGIRSPVDRLDHGSPGGAQAHRRRGETPCAPCAYAESQTRRMREALR